VLRKDRAESPGRKKKPDLWVRGENTKSAREKVSNACNYGFPLCTQGEEGRVGWAVSRKKTASRPLDQDQIHTASAFEGMVHIGTAVSPKEDFMG